MQHTGPSLYSAAQQPNGQYFTSAHVLRPVAAPFVPMATMPHAMQMIGVPQPILPPLPGGAASSNGTAAASAASATTNTVTFRNLKVGGLPPDITDSDLYQLFERFGKVESAKVMLNVHTGESRGYGFVLFDTQEAGCRAFGEMNNKTATSPNGSVFTMDVKSSDWDGRQAAIETNSIYVRNIPNSTTEEELRSIFSQWGTIVSLSTRMQPGQQQQHQAALIAAVHFGATPNATAASTTAALASSVDSQQEHGVAGGDSFDGHTETAVSGSSPPLHKSPGGILAKALPSNVTTEPLGKLAMIEYTTVDSARAAIAATHRVFRFPQSGNVPVLSKFADPPQLKESKRQVKKQHQQHTANPIPGMMIPTAGAVLPQPVGPLPHPFSVSASLPQPPRWVGPPPGTLVFGATPQHSLATPPSHPSPSAGAYASVTSLAHSSPHNTSAPGGMSAPSLGSANAGGVRFPDATPLPLAPRSGFQRIFYQGILGITPDGVLYPIRPEMCFYDGGSNSGSVTFPSTSAGDLASSGQQPQHSTAHPTQPSTVPAQGLLELVFSNQEGAASGPMFYVFPSQAGQQQQHGTVQRPSYGKGSAVGGSDAVET